MLADPSAEKNKKGALVRRQHNDAEYEREIYGL